MGKPIALTRWIELLLLLLLTNETIGLFLNVQDSSGGVSNGLEGNLQ